MTADDPSTGDPTTGDPSERDVPPKATLFCPDCGHRSHVDGDWNVVETARTVHRVCPDCRTVIATRPTDLCGAVPRRGGTRSRPAPLLEAWGAGLRACGRLWRWTVLSALADG